MFGFGVISRFRQEMLAVKGMVRLTESELAVLFGVQGGNRVCVSTACHREQKIEFFKITIGPQEVRWY
jgi:hypothetical protein